MFNVLTPFVIPAPCCSILFSQLLWFLSLFLWILTLVLFTYLRLLQELLN